MCDLAGSKARETVITDTPLSRAMSFIDILMAFPIIDVNINIA